MRTLFGLVLVVGAGVQQVQAATAFFVVGSPQSVAGSTAWLATPAQGFDFRAIDPADYEITNQNAVPFGQETYWDLNFIGPNYALVQVGAYPDAQRLPFQEAGHPGLSFTAGSRGDNQLSGAFWVFEAAFSGNSVQKLAVDFIQYDELDPMRWNWGSFRFNSDVPITFIPEPAAATLLLLGMLGLGGRRPRLER